MDLNLYLWYWKQPLYQLSLNHCPSTQSLLGAKQTLKCQLGTGFEPHFGGAWSNHCYILWANSFSISFCHHILPKSFVKRRGVCANLSWVNLISRPGFIDWPNRFYFFCNLLHWLNGNEFCSIESCLAPNSANLGREPWSSGYGRRLVYRKSWVRIPALHTGWL